MSDEISKKIPPSWGWACLADLGAWSGGGTPSKSNTEFWSKGKIPWVSPKDMKTFEIFDSEDHITKEAVTGSATSLLPSGTILLVTRSGILRHTLPVAVARVPVSLNQDLKALQPHQGLLSTFVGYAIRAFGQQILHTCVKDGTTVQSVEFSDLKQFKIPIAPSNEQQRIADALDELLSDLDAGVEALRRAQAKLALYRASVLKAAVQGDLTAEWRKQHPDAEPASALLEQILRERRQRWEQEQLRKFKAAGKTPPATWEAKYKEPVAPDTTNLPPLPKGWCWATVDQCSFLIQYGTSSKTNGIDSGIPVLRMGNITILGNLIFDELKYLPSEHEEFPELLLQSGDLLFNRTNSAELVGKTAQYTGVPAPCSFASYLIKVRTSQNAAPALIAFALNGVMGRQWIKDVMNQTVGQANVNGTKLASFAFPLPPRDEQDIVVEYAEGQLSVIDHLEADLNAKMGSATSLRQSILHHAFTGQLVPQDPKDEPASELLKRIAAERESRKKTKASPRKQTAKRQKREK